jgi:hypothetical protein
MAAAANSELTCSSFTYGDNKTLSEDFMCLFTSLPMYDPVTHTCGNTYCRSCLARVLKKTCPHCNKDLLARDLVPAALIIKNILAEVTVICIDCKTEMKREQLWYHQSNSCKVRLENTVKCSKCSVEMKYKEMKTHPSTCGASVASAASVSHDVKHNKCVKMNVKMDGGVVAVGGSGGGGGGGKEVVANGNHATVIVNMKSRDGVIVSVPLLNAIRSELIKNCYESADDTDKKIIDGVVYREIPIPGVSVTELRLVAEYMCGEDVDTDMKDCSDWYRLLRAANYMWVQDLVFLCCCHIHGIHDTFGVFFLSNF